MFGAQPIAGVFNLSKPQTTEITQTALAEILANPKKAYREKISLISKIHSGKIKIVYV